MHVWDALQFVALLVAIEGAFVVSASVGLGGSLLMVPTLALAVGTREGVALAALLLASNNVLKAITYRRTIPWRMSSLIVVLTAAGAFVGAMALVHAPESLIVVAVFGVFLITIALERFGRHRRARPVGPVIALASGATSGFSGTSGPLKGVAIRNLRLDRQHFVGAASLVSLVGDLTKSAVYADAALLGRDSLVVVAAAIPLMILGTLTGFRLNRRAGERGFTVMFWAVIAGYSARLAVALP